MEDNNKTASAFSSSVLINTITSAEEQVDEVRRALFKTNDGPFNAEVRQIRQMLTEASSKLANLRSRL